MDDAEFETRLGLALHTSVDTLTVPVDRLVTGGLQRGRAGARRRRRLALAGVAAVTVLAAGGVATYVALDDTDRASVTEVPAGSCSRVDPGVLPAWARTGFSDPEPRVAHVLGDHGRIVAILFGERLFAPPSDDVGNKILWVGKPLPALHDSTDPENSGPPSSGMPELAITARLAGSDLTARREVPGGPGPSIIDLPRAGCWVLDLRWGDDPRESDTMSLEYVTP